MFYQFAVKEYAKMHNRCRWKMVSLSAATFSSSWVSTGLGKRESRRSSESRTKGRALWQTLVLGPKDEGRRIRG